MVHEWVVGQENIMESVEVNSDVRIYMVNTASETSEKKMDCSENSDGTLGTPLEEVNLSVYFTP